MIFTNVKRTICQSYNTERYYSPKRIIIKVTKKILFIVVWFVNPICRNCLYAIINNIVDSVFVFVKIFNRPKNIISTKRIKMFRVWVNIKFYVVFKCVCKFVSAFNFKAINFVSLYFKKVNCYFRFFVHGLFKLTANGRG